MGSLSFRLASSSVTSVSHLSSNVRITPIFWCNGWCEEKFRYCMVCIPSQHTYSGPRATNLSVQHRHPPAGRCKFCPSAQHRGRGRQIYWSNIGIRLRADVSFVRRLNIGPRAANLSGQHRHPPAGRCIFSIEPTSASACGPM